MQLGFAIDHRSCIGCHACTVACKSENDVPVGSFRTWVKYGEVGTFPEVRRHFAVLRCNHCSSAPCVTICPVNALEKRDDGIVDLDRDACIGCKACMQACPYDALYLNEDSGAAEKCHFCAHRVEQGLKPACEVVCPEDAIISGDLDDPESRIRKVMAEVERTEVRRPEQGTGPNVHYLGVEKSLLEPGVAAEPSTYIWSDRAHPPADHDPEVAKEWLLPDTRTVLDVPRKPLWGWMVSLYLITKGLGAGAMLWAPFLPLLGLGDGGILPEVLGVVGLSITTLLLVGDLGRPQKFLTLLSRGNRTSWLVKGAYVLIAFTNLTLLSGVARFIGYTATSDALRWVILPLALMTGIYTAWLFAQCEGRDLWQSRATHALHLLLEALALGAFALLAVAEAPVLALVGVAATAGIMVLSSHEKKGPHDTLNARQAAALLTRIQLPGGIPAWSAGLLGMAGAAAILGIAATFGLLHPVSAAVFTLLYALAAWSRSHAFVQAGQQAPIS